MKGLWTLLGIIAIVAVAVFTGSWIFDIIATCFTYIAKAFRFLSEIFDFFGWNNGIL